jgi:hypothetical protein
LLYQVPQKRGIEKDDRPYAKTEVLEERLKLLFDMGDYRSVEDR